MSTIALPMDGSSLAECVVPHAVTMAQTLQAKIRLLQVLEQPRIACRGPSIDPLDWELCKAQARKYLEGMAARLAAVQLATEIVVLEGDPAEEIVNHVRQDPEISLIIVSSHGQSGLSGWNVSGVVKKILARVNTSVMIVRAFQSLPQDARPSYRRIMVPLDGSQRAEAALTLARRLAHNVSGQIVLTQIVSRPEMPRRTPPTDAEVKLVEKLVERNREEARQYLDAMRTSFGDGVSTRLVVGDDVVDRLQGLVDEEDIDLVVLSAHGYTAPSHRPYGRVAEDFIEYGKTALFVVQDLPRESVAPTAAEIATGQQQGH